MKLQHQSHLANRIFLMVTTFVAITAAASLAISLLQLNRTLKAGQQQEGLVLAGSIARGSELGILTADPQFLESSFMTAAAHPEIVFIAAYDAHGATIREQSRSDVALGLSPETAREIPRMTSARMGAPLHLGKNTVDDFYAPVTTHPGGDAWSESLLGRGSPGDAQHDQVVGLIRIGLSHKRIVAARNEAIASSSGIFAAVLAAAILLSSVFSRRLTKPIAKLEQATRQISEGDLDVELEISSSDEVGALSNAFNAMAGALKQTTVSKDYVDNIVASMSEALVVISADRTIATINDAASRLLGYGRSELAGRSTDLLFADANPMDSNRWEELSRGHVISNIETRFRAKDGRGISVDLSVAPMLNRSGKMQNAVAVARDVSETQRILDELRLRTADLEKHRIVLTSMLEDNDRARALAEAERRKTQTAVDTMSEGLVMFGPAGELLLINPAARRILQMPEGMPVDTDIIIQALGFDFKPFLAAEESDRSAHLLHDLVVGDAVKHTIRIEGMPVIGAEERLGAMLVMRDVTRERQLDDAKHELITNVSHELRTPLAAIANIVSNALVGVTGPVSDKLRSHLEIARINAKRLGNIIDNLIDIASLDAGHVAIHRAPTDFLALAEEVARGIEPEMSQKRIKFDRQITAEPTQIYCDPIAIGQVMRNLLSNAVRYTPQEGIVRFTVERLEGSVEVTIVDSGVGIPLEDQASIFERFHQVGRSYGPGEKGLGLGLPISRHLVEMHGGSIGLASATGRGSRFHFRLPLLEGEALIDAYLSDRIAEMAKGGMRPFLWLFAPRPFAEVINEEETGELETVMLEQLESAVRETVAELRSLVVHIAPREEVVAIVSDRGNEAMQRLAERIEAAFRRFSFTFKEHRAMREILLAHTVCVDPTTLPKEYLEALRRSVN